MCNNPLFDFILQSYLSILGHLNFLTNILNVYYLYTIHNSCLNSQWMLEYLAADYAVLTVVPIIVYSDNKKCIYTNTRKSIPHCWNSFIEVNLFNFLLSLLLFPLSWKVTIPSMVEFLFKMNKLNPIYFYIQFLTETKQFQDYRICNLIIHIYIHCNRKNYKLYKLDI